MSASEIPPEYNADFIRQVTINCVVFGYRDGRLHVLVPRLAFDGVPGSLPGGFVRQSEGIDEAARRILEERTGINDIYLDQFRVFGQAGRSNQELVDKMSAAHGGNSGAADWIRANREWLSQRFISIGYYALVDMRKVVPAKAEIDASVDWYPLNSIPPMFLDHREIIDRALETLRRYLDEKLIGFNLLPEEFTMKELRLLYEAVYDRPFARNNFQKKILDLGALERLGKVYTGASNRAPYLYRFRNTSA